MLEVQSLTLALHYSCRLSLTLLVLITAASATNVKPGCPTTCGDITVPYPFGSSPDGYSCSLSKWYEITCNTSFNPPKPYWGPNNLEVVGISQAGQMRIKNNNAIARECNDDETEIGENTAGLIATASIRLKGSLVDMKAIPFVFSDTENKLIVTGCDRIGMITEPNTVSTVSACISMCSNQETLRKYNGSCSGVGCCQSSIPKGLTMLQFHIGNMGNLSMPRHDFSSCSHAFLGENDKFTFDVDDLTDPSFVNKTRDDIPVVLEWVVGVDETCSQAEKNPSTYACKDNTVCTDIDIGFDGGYRCNCLNGYEGNPYLSPGCIDIDECANSSSNLCSDICTNTPGSFVCSCPNGHRGDGLKAGRGCIRIHQFVMTVSLGVSFGFLLLLISVWIYFIMRRRKLLKIREKFFDQNGGLILKQQLSPTELSRIFSEEELQTATNNYSEDRILGKGGFGTVYKGILKDGREVAIKKPKFGDQDKPQVQEFINEVVILMQTNHKNVVKIFGCCLETKVPLLVYEFISNGTLFEHIKNGGTSWLNWENCIRVATEIVDALAYLHSAALTPIIHRDIKSANILLDGSYTAKIADFGASMLAPIGQTLASLKRVPGTHGYVDPESLQTGRLTEKSDVYSFGVVLAELLTKEKVISSERTAEEASLSRYFVSSMKSHRLLEILDPQIVKEASAEQLLTVGELVIRCLDVESGNRPTMREVAVELEGLKKKMNHPWDISEQSYDEATSLVSQQHGDLYPVSSTDYNSTTTDFSRQ